MSSQIELILKRDFKSLARLISGIENHDEEALAVADELYRHTGKAHVLGVTGLPGAGKSTLVNQLVKRFVKDSKTVGIIAIDPTSPFSGGAVLGDRIRFKNQDYGDKVFFRSMASRGHQGGISFATGDIIHVLDAVGFDFVIVETVGAGQLEVDIAYLVNTLINVTTPEAGDDVQAIKAGIMEIGDIFVINKSDLPGADRKFAQLSIMLQDYKPSEAEERHHGILVAHGLNRGLPECWQIPVIKTQAEKGEGADELVEHVGKHKQFKTGRDDNSRVRKEIMTLLESRFGLLARDMISDNWWEKTLDAIVKKEVAPREVVEQFLIAYGLNHKLSEDDAKHGFSFRIKSVYQDLYIHLIWRTKNSFPYLTPDLKQIVIEYIKNRCPYNGAVSLQCNGIEDHIHILVRMKPTTGISDLVKDLKGSSSFYVNNELQGSALYWQRGYGVLTVSPHEVEKISDYIKNQEDHHRTQKVKVELETT